MPPAFLFGFTLENAENHVVDINIIDNIINIICPENDPYRSFEKNLAFSFKNRDSRF